MEKYLREVDCCRKQRLRGGDEMEGWESPDSLSPIIIYVNLKRTNLRTEILCVP